MTINKGVVSWRCLAEKGGASWLGENRTHTLSVDNLTAHISRKRRAGNSLFPILVNMDDKPWPSGALTLAWILSRKSVARITNAATSYAFAPAIWNWPVRRATSDGVQVITSVG
jgi:uncharacterized protein YhdP